MGKVTTLPLHRNVVLYEARDTLLLHVQSKDTAGVANNLSSYTFRGDVKSEKGAAGTAICAVQFDNTLATGIVKAYLDEDDYDAIVAVVGANGTAYADIVRTSGSGWDEQYCEIVLTLSKVVTGEVVLP